MEVMQRKTSRLWQRACVVAWLAHGQAPHTWRAATGLSFLEKPLLSSLEREERTPSPRRGEGEFPPRSGRRESIFVFMFNLIRINGTIPEHVLVHDNTGGVLLEIWYCSTMCVGNSFVD